MIRISVIVTTYQHAKTIRQTLDSIFAQTRFPDEVIVIDDGSSDGTRELMHTYSQRITYVYQQNSGAPSARNRGFAESKGDYVLFCDADVIMRPDMLASLEYVLELHPEASYAYCRFRWGWKRFRCRAFDAGALRNRNFIHTSAALIRREHFPGFDLKLKKFQDWDVWLTMLSQGHTGVFVDEELYVVMQDHDRNNMSSWLPSIAYVIPWNWIGWKPKRVETYERAREVIKTKHGF